MKKKSDIKEKDSINNNFVFPLALIDEKEDKLNNFITIKKGKSIGFKSRNRKKDDDLKYQFFVKKENLS
jgi:hypothetical protein